MPSRMTYRQNEMAKAKQRSTMSMIMVFILGGYICVAKVCLYVNHPTTIVSSSLRHLNVVCSTCVVRDTW